VVGIILVIQIGMAEGVCSNCGRTLSRRRPADMAVCDCYMFCPLCGKEMQPYTPDLAPSIYGSIESDKVQGDTDKPMDILYYCLSCRYYSALKPVEVFLS
jgi:predicted amidophosphoribosyltransferase